MPAGRRGRRRAGPTDGGGGSLPRAAGAPLPPRDTAAGTSGSLLTPATPWSKRSRDLAGNRSARGSVAAIGRGCVQCGKVRGEAGDDDRGVRASRGGRRTATGESCGKVIRKSRRQRSDPWSIRRGDGGVAGPLGPFRDGGEDWVRFVARVAGSVGRMGTSSDSFGDRAAENPDAGPGHNPNTNKVSACVRWVRLAGRVGGGTERARWAGRATITLVVESAFGGRYDRRAGDDGIGKRGGGR